MKALVEMDIGVRYGIYCDPFCKGYSGTSQCEFHGQCKIEAGGRLRHIDCIKSTELYKTIYEGEKK
jgi:hypothetical protein